MAAVQRVVSSVTLTVDETAQLGLYLLDGQLVVDDGGTGSSG